MADVREMALSLPEVREQLTWEVHPTFRVKDKILAILSEDETTVRVKATKEIQEATIASDPGKFFVPPYVGRHGWIGVNLDQIGVDELRELLEDAWRLTAPKGMVRAFDENAI